MADVVVFYFIFIPLLRHEIAEFCLNWNAHRIRAQPDRANSVGGIPNRLFSSPPEGVQQCGKSPNIEKLSEMAEQFDLYGKLAHSIQSVPMHNLNDRRTSLTSPADEDAYLAEDARIWCENELSALDLPCRPASSDFIGIGADKTFYIPEYYKIFVAKARAHNKSQNGFTLLQPPVGGYNWQVSKHVAHAMSSSIDTANLVEGGNFYE